MPMIINRGTRRKAKNKVPHEVPVSISDVEMRERLGLPPKESVPAKQKKLMPESIKPKKKGLFSRIFKGK